MPLVLAVLKAELLREQIRRERACNSREAGEFVERKLVEEIVREHVEDLLGRPTSVQSSSFRETWKYPKTGLFPPTVVFGRSGQLESWEYP